MDAGSNPATSTNMTNSQVIDPPNMTPVQEPKSRWPKLAIIIMALSLTTVVVDAVVALAMSSASPTQDPYSEHSFTLDRLAFLFRMPAHPSAIHATVLPGVHGAQHIVTYVWRYPKDGAIVEISSFDPKTLSRSANRSINESLIGKKAQATRMHGYEVEVTSRRSYYEPAEYHSQETLFYTINDVNYKVYCWSVDSSLTASVADSFIPVPRHS